jgi:catechol 2,3-dioxygenase-like lactoylglutathione lyase family enzyme
VPRPLGLNHLNLPARDPDALRRWYVRMLDFAEHGRFLWSGGTLLVFVKGEPIARSDAHFGFRVESLDELRAWEKRLRERGANPDPIEGDETYSRTFVTDPEGNGFEVFYEPVPA